jgi:hypothetical protein
MNFRKILTLTCLVAGNLGVGTAQAQIVPTRTDIRLWEQAGNVIAPLERRLHSTRFDVRRTRVIGVEITLRHAPARASAIFPVDCELQKPEGSAAPGSLRLEVPVATGADISDAAMLWTHGEANGWAPGSYLLRCSARHSVLGEVPFEVSNNPPDVVESELRVSQIRLFPATGALPARSERQYATRFDARKITRIGVELEFTHSPPGSPQSIPVDCYYYLPNGRPMGPISFSYEPEAGAVGGSAALAMGWDQPGKWFEGHYTAVCNIRGRPVAVERFAVD